MKSVLIDYMTLRKVIGYIGLFLPFALIIGKALLAPGPLPGSISDYYYTPMRDVLVGALCGMGVFMLTYRGYWPDHIPVLITAVSLIGVALCPTVPVHPEGLSNLVGIFHGVFASLAFVSMSCISLFLFTRAKTVEALTTVSKPFPGGVELVGGYPTVTVKDMTRRKRQRNGVYRICGIVMLADLALVPILTLIKVHVPMFSIEMVAVEAFSISWLVKGQAVPLLKDKK
jgi:hypothetical protein